MSHDGAQVQRTYVVREDSMGFFVEIRVVQDVLAAFKPVWQLFEVLALDGDSLRGDGRWTTSERGLVAPLRDCCATKLTSLLVLVHFKLAFLLLGGAVAAGVAHATCVHLTV